jgi:prepilin peptidase CpaA
VAFLPAALPISVFCAWNDIREMKIPNVAVMALVLGFAVLGLCAFGFPQYLWQWSHLVVVLIVGFVLNAAGIMGAGDAKFAAAAAPFVALGDWQLIMWVFAACIFKGFVTHRIAKYSPLRRLVPHWESWIQAAGSQWACRWA